MTENKRFMLDDTGELIDLNNHKFIDYGDECCNLLNELAEENQQLKKQREELFIRERNTKNEWRELKQENERLRRCINAIYLISSRESIE